MAAADRSGPKQPDRLKRNLSLKKKSETSHPALLYRKAQLNFAPQLRHGELALRIQFGRIFLRAQPLHPARWCNGSTKDSDSFSLGSNPSRAI